MAPGRPLSGLIGVAPLGYPGDNFQRRIPRACTVFVRPEIRRCLLANRRAWLKGSHLHPLAF